MLEMIDLKNDRVVGFRINGKVSTAEFEHVAGLIEERFNRHDKLNIYAEVPEFRGMSAEALAKDLMFALRNWRHFDKEALVTDQRWLAQAAEAAGRFVPGVQVKSFPVEQTAAARAWVVA